MSVNFIATKERSGSIQPKIFLLVLLLLLTAWATFGQEVLNSEKVVIGDSRYFLHTVQKKETLYLRSFGRRYNPF